MLTNQKFKMDGKNSENNLRKNNSKLNIVGADKTADIKEKNKNLIQGNRREFRNYENESTNQLRECVLNKLWGSVPPETRFLQPSQSDNLDSDETEFDLEQGNDEEEEEENLEGIQKSETICRSTCSSRNENELNTSWEVNFDFIQAIIWLKSSAKKRDRIPEGEFCKIFRNQWDLSKKIMSSHLGSETGVSETAAETEISVFRKPLNPINEDFPPPINQQTAKIPDTKRERVELLKDRLRNFDIVAKSLRNVIIPETDESETASVSSIGSQPLFPKIGGSDTTKGQSTVDSGFNSEKPESSDSKSAEMNSIKLPILNKRKHDGISSSSKRKFSKQPRPSIFSATVNYVLKGSECNELLLRSVRAILDELSNEKSASCFFNWQDSVQKEAIEAIVSLLDQLNKEKGPDMCRREVVDTVEKVFQRMLRSNEFEKATIWEHHRLVVFELCNAFTVCTEVIDYLIDELKKLIPVATRMSEKNARESLILFEKSSIIFHSLETLLKKYKVHASGYTDDDKEQTTEKVPEVTELWKRGSGITRRQPDVFAVELRTPESSEDREQAWITILEKLAVASTRHWPLVKVAAWQCLSILKSSPSG